MKDWIKRIAVISVFGAFLAYLCFNLFFYASSGGEIVGIMNAEYVHFTYPVLIGLILLCIYLIVFYGAYPIYFKFSRSALFFVSLALIICSQVMFANSGEGHLYLGDILSVMGVVILFLIPTNVLVTDKIKEKKAKKNEVVIEV